MTIKEFAEGKGLTPQAVYKAVGRAGFKTRQLTDRKGKLTTSGISALKVLFPENPDESATAQEAEPKAESPELVRLREQVEALQTRCRELEQQCEDWKGRFFDAQEHSREEAQQMRQLLSQEQQLRMAAERKGFIRRLFAGKRTDGQ